MLKPYNVPGSLRQAVVSLPDFQMSAAYDLKTRGWL